MSTYILPKGVPISVKNNPVKPKQDNLTDEQKRNKISQILGVNQSGTGFTSGDSIGHAINLAIADTFSKQLQPVTNFVSTISSDRFWLNTGGLIVGVILVLISIQFILKTDLVSTAKKFV